MNAKWILPLFGVLVLSACHIPKPQKYKYTPPPTPGPFDGKFGKELEEQLKKSFGIGQCKEATPTSIVLKGNLDPDRVKDLTGGKVQLGEARGTSYKEADGAKGKLMHNGCPEELVAAEAGDLEVTLMTTTIASAKKVLLCGKVTNAAFLNITAAEVVLKDFDFRVAAIGGISLKAGILVLEGANKISTVGFPVGQTSLVADHFSINVETGVQGLGSLELDSKVLSCAQVEANREKAKAEREKAEKEKIQSAEPKK